MRVTSPPHTSCASAGRVLRQLGRPGHPARPGTSRSHATHCRKLPRAVPLPARALPLRLDVAADGVDQFAAAGVTGQLPEERAAEALAPGEAHLAGDGARGVVAPPLAALEAVRGTGDRAGGRGVAPEHLVVVGTPRVRA